MTTPTTSDNLHESPRIVGRQDSVGAQIVGSKPRSKHAGPGPHLMLADTLTGNDVINYAGEELGEIKGIMLDVECGRIAYVVLSVGGFLGIGNHLFAIPWSALKLDTDRKAFVLNANKELLKNAPGFDKDNWPKMADVQWANRIHSYYSISPYWDQ